MPQTSSQSISYSPSKLVPPQSVKSWRSITVINESTSMLVISQGTDNLWLPPYSSTSIPNLGAKSVEAELAATGSDVTLYMTWYAPGEQVHTIVPLTS